MSSPFGEVVVIHARTKGTADADGNDTFTSSDTTVNFVTLYPRTSSEAVQGQDLNIIGLVAVFIPAVTVGPLDQITARGALWDVDGDPGQYHSPMTGREVTKVNLRRATG